MTNVILDVTQDGYRTYRIIGDSEPVLRVACPKAELGTTCAKLPISVVDLANLPRLMNAGMDLVESVRVTGCQQHDLPARPSTSQQVDQVIAGLDMTQVMAVRAAVLAQRVPAAPAETVTAPALPQRTAVDWSGDQARIDAWEAENPPTPEDDPPTEPEPEEAP